MKNNKLNRLVKPKQKSLACKARFQRGLIYCWINVKFVILNINLLSSLSKLATFSSTKSNSSCGFYNDKKRHNAPSLQISVHPDVLFSCHHITSISNSPHHHKRLHMTTVVVIECHIALHCKRTETQQGKERVSRSYTAFPFLCVKEPTSFKGRGGPRCHSPEGKRWRYTWE